jgi:hypothetical protein
MVEGSVPNVIQTYSDPAAFVNSNSDADAVPRLFANCLTLGARFADTRQLEKDIMERNTRDQGVIELRLYHA